MKKLGIVFPALLLMAGMVFLGCPGPDDPIETGDIDWTLSADGAGANGTGTTDTTAITITFSAEPTGLQGQNISITGGPASINGAITGTGITRIVPVTVTGSGSVSIKITRAGIEEGPKTVQVWKQGEAQKIGYQADADGAPDTTTSTKITITFDAVVTGLAASDIAITFPSSGAGNVEKGDLTGSGKVYVLAITTTGQGNIQLAITKDGVDASVATVAVYMDASAGIVIPEDGQNATMKWTRLAVDPSDDDPDKEAENAALGKGVITGDDFDAIVEATAYKDTFLRLYLDLSESTDPVGYGVGALGNKKNAQGVVDGNTNLLFTRPASGYTADLALKDLKKYYEESDGEIFVNAWNKAKVARILLYVPLNPELETALPDGYTEITLPSVDGTSGKGFLGAVDMDAVNAAGPNAYLEIHGVITSGGNWGALIYDNEWTAISGIDLLDTGEAGAFVENITIAEIRTLVEAAEGAALQAIGFNLWGGSFTEMYLVDPDAMDQNAPVPYTALADGGARKTSSKITFNFVRDVSGLLAGDITITAGTGSATAGALTGSAKVWELAITNVSAGQITVAINKDGINSDTRTVALFFAAAVEVPENGSDADWEWTNLTVDTSVKEGDPDAGKGNIAGDDFDAVVDAAGYKDTFLRVYLDLSEAAAWPGGALGNLDDLEGASNLKFDAPSSGDYVDLKIKDLRKYFDDSDGFIYVNAWNGAKVIGILLFVPTNPEVESNLPDGVIDISLPEADGITGKGELGSVDVAAINAAPEGSYLELYVVGSTQENVGWGIGFIGPSWDDKDCVQINSFGTGDGVVKIMLADLFAKYTGDVSTIIINLWNCGGLSKLWLCEPAGELTLFGEIEQSSDYAWQQEGTPFKGKLTTAKSAEIKALDGVLRVYVTGTMESSGFTAGWGVGKVGSTQFDVPGSAPSSGEFSFEVDFPIDEIALESDSYDSDFINIDIWNGTITKIEIWTY